LQHDLNLQHNEIKNDPITAPPEQQPERPVNPFDKAIVDGDELKISQLMLSGVEPDVSTFYNLCKAFPQLREDIFEKYHTLGDVCDEDGNNLIHLAAQNNDVDLLEFFVRHDTPIGEENADGRTALHEAAINNSVECILRIIELEPELLDKKCSQLDSTPLHYAIEHKATKAATALIYNNADPNVGNDDNMSALHVAAKESNETITRLLCQTQGVLLNKSDDRGNTAIHYAAKRGAVNICRALIEAHAQVDIYDIDGNTPLHIAISRRHIDAALYLIECGADPYILNKEGKSALHIEMDAGHDDIFRKIIHGYDIQHIQNNDTHAPEPIVNAIRMRFPKKETPHDVSLATESEEASVATESHMEVEAPYLTANEQLDNSNELEVAPE
jgi:ankyrin repeat protein